MKIKITTEQYNKILLHEQKNVLLRENEMLAISKLLGIELSGYNKKEAEEFLNKKENIEKIETTLETNSDKLKEFFKSKGEQNFENFIEKNGETLIKNFNEKAKQMNINNRIGKRIIEKLK
jgi:hypothetical protein